MDPLAPAPEGGAGSGGPRRLAARGLVAASAGFAVFLLTLLALFGWLLFRSLSRRVIEQTLLESQGSARIIAGKLEGGAAAGQATAFARQREVQTYVSSLLAERQLVQSVEIRDRQGRVLFRGTSSGTQFYRPLPAPEMTPGPPDPEVERRINERAESFEVAEPIAGLGVVTLGIDKRDLGRRIGVLRGELLRLVGATAAVSIAGVFAAYLLVWRLLRRNQALAEAAAEAERLADLGTLASGLAHEIRNPLNAVRLNVQMLGEELPDGAPRALVAETEGEVHRLEKLVTDFLAFARPQPPRLEDVDVAVLAGAVAEFLRPEIERAGIAFDATIAGQLPHVAADAAQVRQILLNLLRNAATAATLAPAPSPRVALSAWADAALVRIEVRDSGPGIPAAERQRIFEVFHSTFRGGSGLGLPIARRLARQHGGEIAVTDAPEGGACFTLRLPLGRGARLPD